MCLSRNNIGGAGDKLDGPIGHGVVHDDLAHSENPSAEQFRMLLNLLPPQSIAQVRDLDSISIDEADILMAAVNYIMSLTNQLQNKMRWPVHNNNNRDSFNNNHHRG